MLLNGVEFTRSRLPEDLDKPVRESLRRFVAAVEKQAKKRNLTRGQVPFLRPVNFVVFVTDTNVYIVVEDGTVPGLPEHNYWDVRNQKLPDPRRQSLATAIHALGYKNPVLAEIPLWVETEDEDEREDFEDEIEYSAERACDSILYKQRIGNLLKPGFENYGDFLRVFVGDNPNPDRNVFLMMRFKPGKQYEEIRQTLIKACASFGLKVIRADDRDYTGELWQNVVVYMLGCKYGIAVFEEIDAREFNPNVALELGFMTAHNKRCLILKDSRMPKMPTDIIGKLYKEFDTYNIEDSITKAVNSWAIDIGLKKIARR